MGLLKKLRKKEIEQKVEQSQTIKKPTLTEKLGIPFDLNEIEYISIIHQDLDEPMYYIAVSNKEKLKILTETRTNSKEEIISKLSELKSHFKPYGNYVDLGLKLPIINLNRIKSTQLVYDKPDENGIKKNYTIIYLSNDQTYHTDKEISTSTKINKNEFIHFTFWSNRNERLHGK